MHRLTFTKIGHHDPFSCTKERTTTMQIKCKFLKLENWHVHAISRNIRAQPGKKNKHFLTLDMTLLNTYTCMESKQLKGGHVT